MLLFINNDKSQATLKLLRKVVENFMMFGNAYIFETIMDGKISRTFDKYTYISAKMLLKCDVRLVLCKHVIDRSQGQLVDITFVYDYNDALLLYVVDSSDPLCEIGIYADTKW
ncbi:hypothetical protein Tco_0442935 [Tanacetum coccineum]